MSNYGYLEEDKTVTKQLTTFQKLSTVKENKSNF
ncbi:hypothetical protein MCERE19_03372 [Spirosomataceae bacterium]|jgi:hypothetical protein